MYGAPQQCERLLHIGVLMPFDAQDAFGQQIIGTCMRACGSKAGKRVEILSATFAGLSFCMHWS
jgi:hypothetical protein